MIKFTGTTICGIIYKDGVILGADTRATMREPSGGTTLFDQNCSKISRLSQNIYCCGAGSAADMKKLSDVVEAYLDAYFNPAKEIPVICPVTLIKRTLYKYSGNLMCAFIIGGVDRKNGNQLFCLYQHGSSHSQKFCTMGSGSQAALGMLESYWREDMDEMAGCNLLVDAMTAGMTHDLGSGGKIDATIIRKNGEVSNYKPFKTVGAEIQRFLKLSIPLGTTIVLSTQVIPIKDNEKCLESKKTECEDFNVIMQDPPLYLQGGGDGDNLLQIKTKTAKETIGTPIESKIVTVSHEKEAEIIFGRGACKIKKKKEDEKSKHGYKRNAKKYIVERESKAKKIMKLLDSSLNDEEAHCSRNVSEALNDIIPAKRMRRNSVSSDSDSSSKETMNLYYYSN